MRYGKYIVSDRIRYALYCAVAFMFIAPAGEASDKEAFELIVHETELPGTREIEAGKYERAVKLLESRLGTGKLAKSRKTPLLIDLCVANIMIDELDRATDYCQRAVENGWSRGLAYNTRGVLNIAKRDYEAALVDFDAAVKASGTEGVASRNFRRVQNVMAARQGEGQSDSYLAAADSRQ